MTREAEKTWNAWSENEKNMLSKGSGIDIGCGDSPIIHGIRCFDREDGDANCIRNYIHEQFDYVFSSHCLEHMNDPFQALNGWWDLVRPGGFMIIIVPDEDLYEQGFFPSLFNPDHKWTFTLSKRVSWSPKSINITDLIDSLDCVSAFRAELQDDGYDRTLLCFRKLSFLGRCLRFLKYRLFDLLPLPSQKFNRWYSHFFPVDQTVGSALAQIQVTVYKR